MTINPIIHNMYTEYSKFYDALYEGKRLDIGGVWEEDKSFWLEQARKAGSPILELACGSGRLAVPITQLGLNVYGVDNSPEMLALLKKKWDEIPEKKGNLAWELSSMSEGNEYPFGFNLAFAAVSVIQYLQTRDEQERAFNKVFSSLGNGGKFIVDVFNPNPNFITAWGRKILMKQVQDLTDPNLQKITWFCTPESFDDRTHVLNMPSEFVFETPDGEKTLTLPSSYYCYTKEELEGLFLETGFRDITTVGGYNQEPFTEESKRIIMSGIK